MRLTVGQLALAALEAMEGDPLYQSAIEKCPLEYAATGLITPKITSSAFDVVGSTRYGTNEGIVGYASVDGEWSAENHSNPYIVTFKTLRTDKDAYINMGLIVTLFCYYANRIIETFC